jgi:hypothetical protein
MLKKRTLNSNRKDYYTLISFIRILNSMYASVVIDVYIVTKSYLKEFIQHSLVN